MASKYTLKDYAGMVNIAEEAKLSEQQLNKIGQDVLAGYREDLSSSQQWLNDARRVTELASLKSKRKTKPLPNSANIKLPLITDACYEFSSNIYPEIVKNDKIVKYRVIGKDTMNGDKEKQGQRCSEYMNYQLLFKNTNWENDLDTLLNQLPLVGFICKKQYYDPTTDEIESVICHYEDLIVNENIRNLKTASRITHVIKDKNLNDVIEEVRAGTYRKGPIESLIARMDAMAVKPQIKILEQHGYLDLDEDKYQEPYIITILDETGEVLRIAPRYDSKDIKYNKDKEVTKIRPCHYFKDCHFLKNPKGTFRGVGFGILLLHLNETANSIMNMLSDAGQMANMQGGMIDSSFKCLESGENEFDPGQFKKYKIPEAKTLQEGVFPITFKEPSQILHALLGLVIQTAKELTSSTEVMRGASSPENSKTGATQALIQQGQKLVNSIQKRFYRYMTDEFQGIFELNYKYLDPQVYVDVLGDTLAVSKDDFDCEKINIIPIADPDMSSEAKKAQTVQILFAARELAGVDPLKITKRILDSSNLIEADDLMLPADAPQPPNPDMLKLQADIEEKGQLLNIKGREQDREDKRLQMDVLVAMSNVALNKAKAMQCVALADQAQASVQYDKFALQLEAIQTQLDHSTDMAGLQQADMHQQQNQQQTQQQMQQDQNQHTDNTDLKQQEVDNNALPDSDVAQGSS